jgi:hypothetical protein
MWQKHAKWRQKRKQKQNKIIQAKQFVQIKRRFAVWLL